MRVVASPFNLHRDGAVLGRSEASLVYPTGDIRDRRNSPKG